MSACVCERERERERETKRERKRERERDKEEEEDEGETRRNGFVRLWIIVLVSVYAVYVKVDKLYRNTNQC